MYKSLQRVSRINSKYSVGWWNKDVILHARPGHISSQGKAGRTDTGTGNGRGHRHSPLSCVQYPAMQELPFSAAFPF
jgi:hypothetical protein